MESKWLRTVIALVLGFVAYRFAVDGATEAGGVAAAVLIGGVVGGGTWLLLRPRRKAQAGSDSRR